MSGMVAWLITMVPGVSEEVVSMLNPRLADHSVGSIMERLYVERFFGLLRALNTPSRERRDVRGNAPLWMTFPGQKKFGAALEIDFFGREKLKSFESSRTRTERK
jgi:hypothetical protein